MVIGLTPINSMKETDLKYHTLPNGLRIVCEHRPRASAEYFGIVVMAGSRDEAPHQYGIAHFVEHTIFKGTGRRKAWHILNRMEAIGGELNAYTTKEETYVYSQFPKGNLARAVELIYDLVSDSRFPERQIDLERDVVSDEISSYLDSPAEAVYDDFEDIIFSGSGLGHNILGNETTLNSFSSTDCRTFLSKYYVAGNMVVFYSGSMSVSRAFSIIEHKFSNLTIGTVEHSDDIKLEPIHFNERRELSLHQAHTIIGARIPGIYSKDIAVSALFTNIVGGPGMNSLLNLSLRERRGLVYTVEATNTLYRDTGLWSVYFGCDHHDVDKCCSLIRATLETIAEKPITPTMLCRFKRQLIGQMTIARDHRESTILSIARATLYHGNVLSFDQSVKRISVITSNDILEYAKRVLNFSTLTFC